jgi:hypothetical protein
MKRFGRGFAFGLGAGVALLAATPAEAQTEQSMDFALSVRAPDGAGCTPADGLRRAVEEQVGRLVFTDEPRPSRRIDIAVARDATADEWSAAIGMRDDEGRSVGERNIVASGPNCAALDEALIVVLSTLIGIAEEKPEVAATEPVPLPVPLPLPDSEQEHDSGSESVMLAIDVAARGDLGLLPGFAPGAWLSLELDFSGWSLLVGGNFWPYASYDLGLGARARFMAAGGELAACVHAVRAQWASFEVCAGAQAGAVIVATSGLADTARRVEPAARVQVGPRVRFALGRQFGLIARVEAAIPLIASHFYLTEADGKPRYYHTVELGLAAQIGAYFAFSS